MLIIAPIPTSLIIFFALIMLIVFVIATPFTIRKIYKKSSEGEKLDLLFAFLLLYASVLILLLLFFWLADLLYDARYFYITLLIIFLFIGTLYFIRLKKYYEKNPDELEKLYQRQ